MQYIILFLSLPSRKYCVKSVNINYEHPILFMREGYKKYVFSKLMQRLSLTHIPCPENMWLEICMC